MSKNFSIHIKSPTFVDDTLDFLSKNKNLLSDLEYADLVENCIRSLSIVADFQERICSNSSYNYNETSRSIFRGHVAHYITEVISTRGFIEEIERKIVEDIPHFPQSDLLVPQFDLLYPTLKGIRNTLEHTAERQRGLKTGRKPIPNIQPLVRPDGTTAKCGELVIFPPSIVKCHLSDGAIGEVDLEMVSTYLGKMLGQTVQRFPDK